MFGRENSKWIFGAGDDRRERRKAANDLSAESDWSEEA